MICNNSSQSSFSSSRRPVKNYRSKLVCCNSPSQKPTFPNNVILTNIFIKISRSHSSCKRSFVFSVLNIKQIHKSKYTINQVILKDRVIFENIRTFEENIKIITEYIILSCKILLKFYISLKNGENGDILHI